jgi:two-component system LytT family response regulator
MPPDTPPPALLRAVIVDDEELARRGLRRDLAALGGVAVVADCADGFEAVKAVAELKPDLVLLDIQMPRLDGFEVLSLLDPAIAVIFVTAHDDRAVQAFEVNAVDYVMKPVDPERLRRAVERARDRIRRREPMPAAKLEAAARQPGEPLTRLLVRDGARVHVIPAAAIDYIEAQDDYIVVRAHPPLLHPESGSARSDRAVRQGQPRRHPQGRHPPAAQPRRPPEAARAPRGITAYFLSCFLPDVTRVTWVRRWTPSGGTDSASMLP